MAFNNFYANQDATIYEEIPSINTGMDPILELKKNDLYKSRIVMNFNINEIQDFIINNNVGSDRKFYLKLYTSDAVEIPFEYTVEVHPLSQSFNMGIGRYDIKPIDTYEVNWLNAKTNVSWSVTGSSYLSSPVATQSFEYESTDLNIDVTTMIEGWLTQSIERNGLVIKYSDSIETSSNYTDIKFFSVDTHTIYPPRLVMLWDDYSYVTSSYMISSSLSQTVSSYASSKSPLTDLSGYYVSFPELYLPQNATYSYTETWSYNEVLEPALLDNKFSGFVSNFPFYGKYKGRFTGEYIGMFTGSLSGSILPNIPLSIDDNVLITNVSNSLSNTYVDTYLIGTYSGSLDGLLIGDLTGSINGSSLTSASFSSSINNTFDGNIIGYYSGSINGNTNLMLSGSYSGSIFYSVDAIINGIQQPVDLILSNTYAHATLSGNFNGYAKGTLSDSVTLFSYFITGSRNYIVLEQDIIEPLVKNDIIIYVKNPLMNVQEGSVEKIYVIGRERYPKRTYWVRNTYLDIKALPSSSYYAVYDAQNDDIIQNYDEKYTKLSCDTNGNYFYLYTEGLQVERLYRLVFKVKRDNKIQIFDNNYIFKVTR